MCEDFKIEEILNAEFDPATPMPGDFVRVQNSTDPLIRNGSYGVVEGVKGQKRNIYSVCFNPSTMPWGGGADDKYVTSSGGPAYYIEAEKLKPTGDTIEAMFYTERPILRTTFIVQRRVRVFEYFMGT